MKETVQRTMFLARMKKRMSMRDVAAALNTTPQMVLRTEKAGKTLLSDRTDFYKKLCKLYGLDEQEIYEAIVAQRAAEKKQGK